MQLSNINPFMRYAELQATVKSSAPLSSSYDYRLFYVLGVEGDGKLVLKDSVVRLAKDSIIYLRPGTPYYFDGKVKVIVINFDMSRDNESLISPIPPSKNLSDFDINKVVENSPPKELNDVIIVENAFETLENLQKCLTNYNYPTIYSDALSSACIKQILCYIVKRTAKSGEEIPELIKNIILYISQNYDKELTNNDIANHFKYHSFYLNRLFKKYTGKTLHQTVIEEKIKVAKRMLKEGNLTVNEVSSELGFLDRSQFCTVFKKQTGFTPLEYKKLSV
jgi:YesN/AraC family two-component response regulator